MIRICPHAMRSYSFHVFSACGTRISDESCHGKFYGRYVV